MVQPAGIDPDPFILDGDATGVLLLHGFTGAPVEMRPIGDALELAGRTVFAPLLPGHGTSESDLGTVSWETWYERASAAFEELQRRCDEVFVMGLSMGSLLSAKLAAEHAVAGVVAFAPALEPVAPVPLWMAGIAKHFKKRVRLPPSSEDLVNPDHAAPMWNYEGAPTSAVHELHKLIGAAERALPDVSAPLLILMGRHDKLVRAEGARRYLERAGSGSKDLIWFEGSGHGLTVDAEREAVAARAVEFVERYKS
jgi:carboxylesterase